MSINITFRAVAGAPEISDAIEEHLANLEQRFCQVVIMGPGADDHGDRYGQLSAMSAHTVSLRGKADARGRRGNGAHHPEATLREVGRSFVRREQPTPGLLQGALTVHSTAFAGRRDQVL